MTARYNGPPMTLRNMRENGCQEIALDCVCRHHACVNVDHLDAALYVPDVSKLYRCSKCGERPQSRPAWHTGVKGPGVP